MTWGPKHWGWCVLIPKKDTVPMTIWRITGDLRKEHSCRRWILDDLGLSRSPQIWSAQGRHADQSWDLRRSADGAGRDARAKNFLWKLKRARGSVAHGAAMRQKTIKLKAAILVNLVVEQNPHSQRLNTSQSHLAIADHLNVKGFQQHAAAKADRLCGM